MIGFEHGKIEGLRDARRLVKAHKRRAVGGSAEQKGQRRACTRLLKELDALIDPAPSYSEDAIDEGLLA